MTDNFQLVTVYRSQGILGAEVVRAKLEAAGVPAILKYESAGLVIGLTVDGLGLVEVQVPEGWEADARALIEESDDAEDEPAGETEAP
ncbi:MAG: hypothetical protein BWY52_00581 [Chloroflexi bacterium ADurb.Bin325]|nr:MAG: hypothetical protein BWY52_00581 [Chloroflexi bacterium ADurb.Bin325]